MRKYAANMITGSRILCSVYLLACPVLSLGFYIIYIFAGITDMVDGTIARKLNAASEFGSKLDTAADMVFAAVCMTKLLPTISIPGWLWFLIAVIAVIKIRNIVWCFIRSKQLLSLHTGFNKITGLLLFLFPLTLGFIEPVWSLGVTGFFALAAAIQECLKMRRLSYGFIRKRLRS